MKMRYLCFIIFLLTSFEAMSADLQAQIIPRYNVKNYDEQINYIYHTILYNKADTISQRIVKVSSYFLGKPYLLFATGEGPEGEFDKSPLYRTDAFDCMTFVEMTMALARSDDLAQFKQTILHIRYKTGIPAFVNRNHFTSVDWNVNNTNNGYLKDITPQLTADYKITTAVINKPGWYEKLPPSRLRLFTPLSSQQTAALLNKLHANAAHVTVLQSQLKYIPFSVLYHYDNNQFTPDEAIFAKIPNAAIIEIIDPSRNKIALNGTVIEVTHLGFVVRTQQGLMFREASQIKRRVVDVPLVAYLQRYAKVPGGIEVQIVN